MREGFFVEIAASCGEAKGFAGPFDAAIVDLNLGDGNGLELGSELLERRVVRRVCFFSGVSDPDLERRARSIGDFVQKGASARELVERLSEKSPGAKLEAPATIAHSSGKKRRTASGQRPRAAADAGLGTAPRRRSAKTPRSA